MAFIVIIMHVCGKAITFELELCSYRNHFESFGLPKHYAEIANCEHDKRCDFQYAVR